MNIPGSTDAELIAAWDRGRRAGLEEAREEGRKEGKAEALAIIRARISDLASIDDHWATHRLRALREIAEEIEAEE